MAPQTRALTGSREKRRTHERKPIVEPHPALAAQGAPHGRAAGHHAVATAAASPRPRARPHRLPRPNRPRPRPGRTAPPPPPVAAPTPQQLAAVTAAQAEPAHGCHRRAGGRRQRARSRATRAPSRWTWRSGDGSATTSPRPKAATPTRSPTPRWTCCSAAASTNTWAGRRTSSPPTARAWTGRKSTASILDLIGKFELHDTFNVWFGRMLVPSDRSNFSGAWFMAPWSYPGFFVPGGGPIGPRQGAFGRNDGATVWGQFGGGLLKYYASVFDLTAPQTSPLYLEPHQPGADQPRAGLLPQQHLLRRQGHPGRRPVGPVQEGRLGRRAIRPP